VNNILKLIVNYGNLITINNKVLGLLIHINFGRWNDNLMHDFNHLPINAIKPMFTWHVFHLQNIKKLLQAFKFCQWFTKFQKLEYELTLLLSSFTRNNHHFNNGILTLVSPQSFILGMLNVHKHEILAHSKSKDCNLALLPTCMFLQTIIFPYHHVHYKFCSDPC